MLFNSLQFIFLFLPVTSAGFYLLGRIDRRLAASFLALASLVFYGWWDGRYVLLLLASVFGNYLLSGAIYRRGGKTRSARILLITAITANLAVLCYYKYAGFFVANLNALGGMDWAIRYAVLPLGISFFTFTQIAFIVDTYRGLARERSFINYLLFITYFPHLIAGPILHHAEMMPQFAGSEAYRLKPDRLAIGISLFIMGLGKKVLCADWIAPMAGVVFAAAGRGQAIDPVHAWGGALAYAMQIYFDFSAYSDMALGISIMFGIRLPLNFYSPYQSRNIIEFWRRWHMSLSRFLRDYLYFSLGGSRCSVPRRYVNLMITMVLGGLWHGAAWTYVAWGALHGAYLIINHGWRRLTRGLVAGRSSAIVGGAVTFVAVTVAWVFFRASSLASAMIMLKGMVGIGDAHGEIPPYISNLLWVSLPPLLAICWFLPNAYEMLGELSPSLQPFVVKPSWLRWRPNNGWAICLGTLGALSLAQIVSGAPSEFIYFQF